MIFNLVIGCVLLIVAFKIGKEFIRKPSYKYALISIISFLLFLILVAPIIYIAVYLSIIFIALAVLFSIVVD